MGSVQSLIQQTALHQASASEFYGLYRGFPLGLRLIGHEAPEQASRRIAGSTDPVEGQRYSLLVHVRFPDRASPTSPKPSCTWGDCLQSLLEQGRARVSVEARIAWLTLYEANDLVASEAAVEILNAFIDGLASAGIQKAGDRCHYCGKTIVKEPTYVEERVAWICPACLAAKTAEAEDDEHAASLDGPKLLLAACLGALIGAAAWAGLWISYECVMEWIAKEHPSGKVRVPTIVLEIFVVGGALLVGGPSGVLVRRLAYPGSFARTVSACGGTVAAIAMGEIAWVLWLFPQLPGMQAAIRLLPVVWRAEEKPYCFLKLMAVIFSIGCAFLVAKPSRRQLDI
jgi:hypothetical protein